MANVKGLLERDVANRTEGDYIWLKLAVLYSKFQQM